MSRNRRRQNRRKEPRMAYKVPHGPSIIERLEERMEQAVVKHKRSKRAETRGIIRGLAISIAMMRNEEVSVVEARAMRDSG